jgi:hypothetical protein
MEQALPHGMVLSQWGVGFNIIACLTFQALRMDACAFVDDTDTTHVACSTRSSGETVLHETQSTINLWEGLLKVTGGALRPDKSLWCLADVKFVGGKWRQRSSQDMLGQLSTLADAEGDRHILTWLKPSQANETRGIFIPMDAAWQDKALKLIGLARQFADQLRVGFFTPTISGACSQ